MSDLTIAIDCNALTSAPVWENHARGKNWFASIKRDPTAPGGLSRQFADKARGDGFVYLVPTWAKPGVACEFGADYYTGSGKKSATREYYVIVNVTAKIIEFTEYKTAIQACKAAGPDGDAVKAWEMNRMILQEQLALEAEMNQAVAGEAEANDLFDAEAIKSENEMMAAIDYQNAEMVAATFHQVYPFASA